ncbi:MULTISPECIES: AI-2E family transporter [unclassified Microbacterium]|uniref:AI-2E family transporter n=1 Tax=unclassified Microbacterium TaxID=2609290 RepID=UPI0024688A4C|nr:MULTISPECIES: AI-2E family transporter [unclassified Microbacterium]MDH5132327.1 AI-2E family transporter [Microbacterium sp. RD10]MDH5135374.1 AI-2E family transporter [Microbacterium sp. RD11]MDH5143720.1 AI-2E family transporter [Microbacterium sp. RD12]MDH5154152.1 AI-2E family transporter [Microbacterium sp. RD06]MDH5164680.1 AI-2E family transporter [Microbacterium sp. RD02]
MRRRKLIAPPDPAPSVSAQRRSPSSVVAGARANPFMFGLLGALGVLVALMIGGIVGQLATVLVYIGVALFLALGLDPIVRFIERKLPRPAAVAVVVIGVLLAFAGIILAIVPTLVEQIGNLIKDGPEMIKEFTKSAWFQDVSGQFGSTIQDAVDGVLGFVQNPDNFLDIGGGVFAVGAGIAGGLTGVTIVLILTLYFMASLRSMKRVAARFVPAYQRDTFSELLEDVSSAVGRYVIGQASLALTNGVLSLIFLTIIGAPVPALLALIAFIGSMIPLVGTLSASIIISLICLFVSPTTALIAIIYYLIYMQIEAYVLSPRIMNKAVDVPGALVVIAAVAGGALGGILGALVAIPVAASIIIIVQKVVFPNQDRKRTPPAVTVA